MKFMITTGVRSAWGRELGLVVKGRGGAEQS